MPTRYPRYGRFILTGLVVGVLAAVIVVLVVPHDGGSSILWRIAVLTGPVGGILGALAAIWAERRASAAPGASTPAPATDETAAE